MYNHRRKKSLRKENKLKDHHLSHQDQTFSSTEIILLSKNVSKMGPFENPLIFSFH